ASLLFALVFFLSSSRYAVTLHLHSFPTRRSSDLIRLIGRRARSTQISPSSAGRPVSGSTSTIGTPGSGRPMEPGLTGMPGTLPRSEEHTSELQSRGHLVCRLLLEKKKT